MSGRPFPRKLSDDDVREIRRFVDEGWTQLRGNTAAIALAYGCASSTVSGIGLRDNRPDVPELLELEEPRC